MNWEFYSLPLLTKELIEQAQNRRTYILRVVYAVVLYGAALFQYADLQHGGTAAGLMNLGRGQNFFQLLFAIQAFAIVLLLPAMTCGALTVEKEKDTLALLLLTKLSPWTIVFEKLLSRVFAIGTYQLLSLPLFAIVYGMGGVELSGLILAIGVLICLTIVVGSVSILCSTWFRTTSEAFIMAYLALFAFGSCFSLPAMPVIGQMVMSNRFGAMPYQPRVSGWEQVASAMISLTGLGMATFVVSAISLVIASRVLVARAFVRPRNIVLEWFQSADRYFNELNKKTTGGIVLVQDRATLPTFQPIAWRETRKKSLGTFRYQFRILMLLLAPLILVIAAFLMDGRNDFTSPFRGFPVFFWSISVICLTIHSTGVIPSERIRQSLDVLLVAPIPSAEIVVEKLSGVRRLIKILTVPFAVLIIFQGIWTGYVVRGSMLEKNTDFWMELTAATLTVVVYMPLTMWVGFQFGLRLRSQVQAVLATFAVVISICVLPLILARTLSIAQGPGFAVLRWISPLQLILSTRELVTRNPTLRGETLFAWLILLAHFVGFGIAWWLLRRNALLSFSRSVHRLEVGAGKAD